MRNRPYPVLKCSSSSCSSIGHPRNRPSVQRCSSAQENKAVVDGRPSREQYNARCRRRLGIAATVCVPRRRHCGRRVRRFHSQPHTRRSAALFHLGETATHGQGAGPRSMLPAVPPIVQQASSRNPAGVAAAEAAAATTVRRCAAALGASAIAAGAFGVPCGRVAAHRESGPRAGLVISNQAPMLYMAPWRLKVLCSHGGLRASISFCTRSPCLR